MKLDSLEPGAAVFIDANIFIYHFTGVSEECSEFLQSCEVQRVTGITSVTVLLEVLHRLMMIEAVRKKLVYPPNVLAKLQRQPQKVKELHDYVINVQKIEAMGIVVRAVSQDTVMKSQVFRSRYGLLVNDSISVTLMADEGIIYLATKDRGFSQIDHLTVLVPKDIDL